MEKAMQTSTHSSPASLRAKLALSEMASFRQASMDKQTIQLFASRLASENQADVLAALSCLAEQPRREGETAVPDISTILAAVERAGTNRRLAGPKKEALLWQCETCLVTAVTHCRTDQEAPKATCKHWTHLPEKPCGGKLRLIHRSAI